MSARRLPVHTDLDQLKNQAKDLLKAYRDGDREASASFAELHPDTPSARRAKLADAQLVLERISTAPPAGRALSSAASSSMPSGTTTRTRCAGW